MIKQYHGVKGEIPHRGIYRHKSAYVVRVYWRYEQHYVGRFATLEEAIKAREEYIAKWIPEYHHCMTTKKKQFHMSSDINASSSP